MGIEGRLCAALGWSEDLLWLKDEGEISQHCQLVKIDNIFTLNKWLSQLIQDYFGFVDILKEYW